MCAFSALHFSKTAINARKSEINEIILTDLNNDWDALSENDLNETVVQLKREKNEIKILLFITFLGSFMYKIFFIYLNSFNTLPILNFVA